MVVEAPSGATHDATAARHHAQATDTERQGGPQDDAAQERRREGRREQEASRGRGMRTEVTHEHDEQTKQEPATDATIDSRIGQSQHAQSEAPQKKEPPDASASTLSLTARSIQST